MRADPWLERGTRWQRWLETVWKTTLFVLLFVALVYTGLLLLPFLRLPPLEEGVFSAALLGQFALVLAAALTASWLLVRFVDRAPAEGLGFPLRRDVPRRVGIGLLAGMAPPALVVGALALAGAFAFLPEPGSAAGWAAAAIQGLLVLAIPAAAEEAVFRGYAFRTLVRGFGPVAGIAVTSIAFAILHGGNPEVGTFALLNIFLAGVVLAYAALRTGGLWLATAVHLGWNWSLAVLLDLPVSGLEPFDPPLYDTRPAAPDWLTGGMFGPEGGLVGSLSLVGVGVAIWWFTRPGAALAPARTGGGSERVED